MPEFEPLTEDDRRLIGDPGPAPPRPAPKHPTGRHRIWRTTALAGLLLAGFTILVPGPPQPGAPDLPDQPGDRAVGAAQPLPPLPTVTSPVRLAHREAPPALRGELRTFDVAPDGYAAVVTTDCSGSTGCRSLLMTSMSGQRWHRRSVPKGALDGLRIWSLGGGVLVLEQSPSGRRWHSTDGGREWRDVPPEHLAPVPAVSGGALTVTGGNRLAGGPCSGRRLTVVRRADGRSAPLRTQLPGLNPCTALAYPDQAGRLWVTAVDPATRRPAVAYSDDTGAHWRVTMLPDFGGRAEEVWFSLAGADRYVTVFGPLPVLPGRPRGFGVVAVFWHDGHQWNLTARYGGPSREVNNMISCPGGMLLAVQRLWDLRDRPRQMVSYDHGRTWGVTHSPNVLTGAAPTTLMPDTDRYAVLYTPLGLQGLVRSGDCRTWAGFAVR